MVLIAVLALSAVPPHYADAQESKVRIDGAGASFAFPLIDLWRVKYVEDVKPNIELNYQSIGSGGGVKQHIEKTVNFAASDVPLRDSEYKLAPGTITIPAMIGAISIIYNVPGLDSGVKITSDALCKMNLHKMSWNDPMIADANPDLDLPDDVIIPVHRADGSGTTFAFTKYLTKVCPEWDEKIGAGKSIPWPTGVGAPGNEGVAGTISTTPNSIGYVTLAYAFQNDLTAAAIENGDSTNFVLPTLETASNASKDIAPTLPKAWESWRNVDLLVAPGEDAYPITSFSYIILHPEQKGSVDNFNHAVEVIDLVAWMITDGQEYNADLLYVPVDTAITNIGLEGLAKITYDGKQVYDGPTSIAVEPEPATTSIPSWVREIFKLYGDGLITDNELINAIQFLISKGIINIT